jgi:peptide/nickel transport system permease protein
VIVGMALIGPLVWRINPLHVNLAISLQPPSGSHPFGTDDLGRDVLARVIAGAGLDLLVALVVALGGGAVGAALGLIAAMSGGLTETLILRVMDALLAFPSLILALSIALALGAGTVPASVGIAISVVPYYARLMRSEVLRIKAMPYVEAAVASGSGQTRLVWRHVIPHTSGTMLIQTSSSVGYAVLTLAALGFVGLGVQEPTAEWGTMITSGLSYVLSGQWWMGVFPGVALLALVVGCSLVADGLSGTMSSSVPVGLATGEGP